MTPNRVMAILRLQLGERAPLPLEEQVEEQAPGRIGERLEHELQLLLIVAHDDDNR